MPPAFPLLLGLLSNVSSSSSICCAVSSCCWWCFCLAVAATVSACGSGVAPSTPSDELPQPIPVRAGVVGGVGGSVVYVSRRPAVVSAVGREVEFWRLEASSPVSQPSEGASWTTPRERTNRMRTNRWGRLASFCVRILSLVPPRSRCSGVSARLQVEGRTTVNTLKCRSGKGAASQASPPPACVGRSLACALAWVASLPYDSNANCSVRPSSLSCRERQRARAQQLLDWTI